MIDQRVPGESWESFAERRIREAQAEGAFSHLPGFGQPIPGIDEPLDENWWIRDKLRRESLNVLPPVLEARLEKERVLSELHTLTHEADVRRRLERLNETIRKAHYSHLAGPHDGVQPVDTERAVAQWRERRGSTGPGMATG